MKRMSQLLERTRESQSVLIEGPAFAVAGDQSLGSLSWTEANPSKTFSFALLDWPVATSSPFSRPHPPCGLSSLLHAGIGVGLALLLLMPWVSCGRARPQKLRIATNGWIGYEPLFLARELEYLPKSSVHFSELANATDVARAFQARVVDMAALTLDETLGVLAQDQDVRIVCVLDYSNGADALLGRASMAGLSALKGKRVGVESGALGAYMLTRALDRAGLSLKDIQAVSVSFGGHEAAFLSGDVDAIVTFEPVRTRLLDKGAKVLFTSADIPGEVVDVLVIHADTWAAHPREVKALQKAWYQALLYLQQHPDDAMRRMAPRLNLTPDTLCRTLKGINLPSEQENQRLLQGELLPPIQRLQTIMLQNHLLRHPVDPAQLLKVP